MDSNSNLKPPTPTYKDYYTILQVDYDATDHNIRLNYRKLALKWHPDKHKGDAAATSIFQEINEAYSVLSDPDKRLEYDLNGNYEIDKYTLREYLARFKGMILTCNGLGMTQVPNIKMPIAVVVVLYYGGLGNVTGTNGTQ
ncbi:dnAJ-like protein slr0093 isoform X3 [Salvia splendens]|uniref:dnAJ-like protein slr0093 isoform X3 n=1 Tax=Salvia splendens TaxID=180675 RepID=UPI001C25A32B|nr:dnAJ-like protein slr0093 isoform X3 [Salvia splendens]